MSCGRYSLNVTHIFWKMYFAFKTQSYHTDKKIVQSMGVGGLDFKTEEVRRLLLIGNHWFRGCHGSVIVMLDLINIQDDDDVGSVTHDSLYFSGSGALYLLQAAMLYAAPREGIKPPSQLRSKNVTIKIHHSRACHIFKYYNLSNICEVFWHFFIHYPFFKCKINS